MGLVGISNFSAAPLSPHLPASVASFTKQYSEATATNFTALDLLPTNVLGYGQSSYNRDADPSKGNTNFGHYLYTLSSNKHVILDEKGPGVVYRMWFAGYPKSLEANPTIDNSFWIRVYFNGSTAPSINVPLVDLFNNSYAPFNVPLVADDDQSSGGYVSYVPLPYQSGIKIVTNFAYFYNIGFDSFTPGTKVVTWSKNENTAVENRLWTNVTQNPSGNRGSTQAGATPIIASGATQTLSTAAGPSTIDAIKIKLPSPATAAELDDIWIEIYWDGSLTADVDAPLGLFFGMGEYGQYDTRSLPVGIGADGYMYMYFPMPFKQSAIIQLVNKGSLPLSPIEYQITTQPFIGNFDDVGYFHTAYSYTPDAAVGSDIPIMQATGTGSYLGTVASYGDITSDIGPWQFLEGGELIYVDDSQTPSFYGTGTEDFFNGGFYFFHGPYSGPVSGATTKTNIGPTEELSAYRFLLGDAVPFYRNIAVSIHHGIYDQTTDTNAWMLSFYYEKPSTSMTLTDSLTIGDAASERGHKFKIRGQVWSGSRTLTYAGASDTTDIRGSGRAFTGYSQFTMALNPNNDGALLRRRFDYGLANQSAFMYVDGSFVGEWYTAGSNPYHRWADSDFLLSKSVTGGRSSVTIKIVFRPTAANWNEFRFWLYSLT
jgi:Protein of unknown function (DUF2961)